MGQRNILRFNIQDLADACGCSRQYLYKYYRGQFGGWMSLSELVDFVVLVRANRKRRSGKSSMVGDVLHD